MALEESFDITVDESELEGVDDRQAGVRARHLQALMLAV